MSKSVYLSDSKYLKACLLTSVFSAALFAQTPAFAQEEDDEIEEVIVTGIRRSLDNAFELKRNADQMIDSITAEDIGLFSDNNIGEALQRIPGVLLERFAGEGFRISIRGLGPRFVRTTVNGRTALSTAGGEDGNSEDSRGFTLNMLPSEIISRVTVEKSTMARNLEGGIGGTLDLQTNRPLDFADRKKQDFFVSAAFRGQYNDIVKELSPRASIFINKKFSDNFGAFFGVVIDEADRVDHALETEAFRVRTDFNLDRLEPGTLLNGTALTQADIDALDASTVGVGPNGEDAGVAMFNGARSTAREFDRARQTYSGGLQWQGGNWDVNFDWTHGDEKNNQFLRRFARSPGNTARRDEDNITSLTIDFGDADLSRTAPTIGTITSFEFEGARGDERVGSENRFIPRSVKIDVGGLNIDWSNDVWTINADVGYAQQTTRRQDFQAGTLWNADDDDRDLRFEFMNGFFDTTGPGGLPTAGLIGVDASGVETPFDPTDLGQFFFRRAWNTLTLESADDISTRLDITRDFSSGGVFDALMAGFAWNERNGTRSRSRFREDRGEGDINGGNLIPELSRNNTPVGDLLAFTVENNLPGVPEAIHDFVFLSTDEPLLDAVFSLSDDQLINRPQDAFDVTESITSGYVQAEFSGKNDVKFRGNIGVRVVHTSQSGTGFEGGTTLNADATAIIDDFTLRTTHRSYTDVLPSANIAFDLRDDLVLRFAGNKAVTRPDPIDLTSFLDLNTFEDDDDDQEIGSGSGGNPDLEPYRTWSLDASLEWYPESGGAYAFGLFYKSIDGWIAQGRTDEVFTSPVGVDGDGDGEFSENDITDGIPGNGGDYFEIREELFSIRRKQNTDGGTIKGFEFSFHQPFDSFISEGFLSYFGVNGSLTYVDAKIDAVVPDNLLPISLRGTSKWSGNAVAYFEKGKFGARLAYNYRSDFLFQEAEDDFRHAEFTRGTSRFDLNLDYKFTRNVRVRLSANNLTGVVRQRYWQTTGTNRFSDLRDSGQSFTFEIRAQY